MKLKDLTGAIRMSELIEIIEVVPFSIVDNVIFRGTLFAYFESDMFKKFGKRSVMTVKATGEKQMEIKILGERK